MQDDHSSSEYVDDSASIDTGGDDGAQAEAPSAERVAATEQAGLTGAPLAGPADVVEGRINVAAAQQAGEDPDSGDVAAASTGLVGGGPEAGDTPAPPTPANPSPGVSVPSADDRTHLNLPAEEQPGDGQPNSVTEGLEAAPSAGDIAEGQALGATADAAASADAAAEVGTSGDSAPEPEGEPPAPDDGHGDGTASDE